MKEKILELRRLGYSYKKIEKELNCSRSTISYHCINYKLNKPVERYDKLSDDNIKNILEDRKTMTMVDISKKYSIGISTIKKYSKGKGPFFHSKKGTNNTKNKGNNICIICGKESQYRSNKKLCSNQCNSIYQHRIAYLAFLNNNENYSRGNYTPKCFKDFFLEEQGNKCAICGVKPIWNNRKIIFVLDHIDGDASNNKRENLRLICPNCDSQTDTFKSKTKVSKRRNYMRTSIENKIKKEIIDNGGKLAG